MGGLILKLAPHERVLVNGAVIENGDRRGRIRILTSNAQILRLKDSLHPDDVDTPVKRVCYVMQLALSGDLIEDHAQYQALRGIEQLSQVFQDSDSRKILEAASGHLVEQKFYPSLKALRKLLSREARMLVA